MGRESRFDEYIDSVLRRVRFQEAHADIRRELVGHLEEARELTAGFNISNEEVETQVIRRMGDADQLGATLNQVHRPKIDLVLVSMFAFLLSVGSYAMSHLDRIGSHVLWLGIGTIPLLTLMFIRPTLVRERSWTIYAGTLTLGALASIFGPWYGGQPYLSLGPISIKFVDLSVVLFVLSLSGPLSSMTEQSKSKRRLTFVAALVPIVAYTSIASFYPAVLLGISCLAMMIASRQPREFISAYSAIGVSLVATSVTSGTFASSESIASLAANEKHTDFVFNFLAGTFPLLGVLTAATAITFATYLISLGRSVKSPYGRTIFAGGIALFTTGIAWGMLSNLGFIPMAATGVYIPFLSYSGSLMIAHMALIGMILSIQRRRSLYFL